MTINILFEPGMQGVKMPSPIIIDVPNIVINKRHILAK